MTKFEFTLHLSAEDYLQYYEGIATDVQVRSHCGKLIQFSADKIREFVLSDGIHGIFEMRTDENNKFLSIRKMR